MAKRSSKLRRPYGKRRYRKQFFIIVEGKVTEPDYFRYFKGSIESACIHIKCIPGTKRNWPKTVLKRVRKYCRDKNLQPNDEVWMVIDKDNRSDTELDHVIEWSLSNDQNRTAISNPAFEIWLLMHFENASGIETIRQCITRLKRHLPTYNKDNKHVDINRITDKHISSAIKRARERDNPPCSKWPTSPGTTVYKLVKSIMACS